MTASSTPPCSWDSYPKQKGKRPRTRRRAKNVRHKGYEKHKIHKRTVAARLRPGLLRPRLLQPALATTAPAKWTMRGPRKRPPPYHLRRRTMSTLKRPRALSNRATMAFHVSSTRRSRSFTTPAVRFCASGRGSVDSWMAPCRRLSQKARPVSTPSSRHTNRASRSSTFSCTWSSWYVLPPPRYSFLAHCILQYLVLT